MKRFGLIGRTLSHSFSKTYFTNKFKEQGLADCVYENFELKTIDEFPLLISSLPDLKGLNVTIPYKEEVIQYLSEKNEDVKAIGACNCISIEDGRLTGFNTDATGFRRSLAPYLQSHHQKALILGTGGASKAIRYVLAQLGIQSLMISREKKAGTIVYEQIDREVLQSHLLIINTTPLGMYPEINEAPPIPYQFIGPHHLLFDAIYNPAKTKFLTKGEERGARIINGHQMLIEQAEESWRIWNSLK
jgi:shikimate dehydrogenase